MIDKSSRVYLGIISVWLLVDLAFWISPPDYILSGHTVSLQRIAIDICLIIGGFFVLKLAPMSGFEQFYPSQKPLFRSFGTPLLIGLSIGLINISLDLTFALGNIHADFPVSIPYYFAGGLYSEIMYKLLPLGILHWALSYWLLDNKHQDACFWILALIVCFYEPYSVLQLANNPNVPGNMSNTTLVYSLVAITYGINLLGSYLFWTRGFLATLSLRWGLYITWHVAWPLMYY